MSQLFYVYKFLVLGSLWNTKPSLHAIIQKLFTDEIHLIDTIKWLMLSLPPSWRCLISAWMLNNVGNKWIDVFIFYNFTFSLKDSILFLQFIVMYLSKKSMLFFAFKFIHIFISAFFKYIFPLFYWLIYFSIKYLFTF